jgi:hypothetical protein
MRKEILLFDHNPHPAPPRQNFTRSNSRSEIVFDVLCAHSNALLGRRWQLNLRFEDYLLISIMNEFLFDMGAAHKGRGGGGLRWEGFV